MDTEMDKMRKVRRRGCRNKKRQNRSRPKQFRSRRRGARTNGFFPVETKRGDAGDEPNKRFERKHMFAQREKKSQQKNLIENKEVETKESFVIKISGGC